MAAEHVAHLAFVITYILNIIFIVMSQKENIHVVLLQGLFDYRAVLRPPFHTKNISHNVFWTYFGFHKLVKILQTF